MTVQTRQFFNWQNLHPSNTPDYCSPDLRLIVDSLLANHGGQDLGCYGPMPVGATYIRSHYHGAAIDYRYADPGPGLDVGQNVILPFLIDFSDELGIEAIHDYYNRRIWRCARTPNAADAHTLWWKEQPIDDHMGQAWAKYFHLEVTKEQWAVTVPIEMRFGVPIGQQTMAPTIKLGSTGDYVRWLQQRLANNGFAVTVDGRFGPNTELMVKYLQGASGLQQDGIVGPKTWAAVNALP